MPKLTQLPSKHFLEEGLYKIRYQVRVSYPYVFTQLAALQEDAVDVGGTLSEDNRVFTWVETTSERAIKYTSKGLGYIFKDMIYIK